MALKLVERASAREETLYLPPSFEQKRALIVACYFTKAGSNSMECPFCFFFSSTACCLGFTSLLHIECQNHDVSRRVSTPLTHKKIPLGIGSTIRTEILDDIF